MKFFISIFCIHCLLITQATAQKWRAVEKVRMLNYAGVFKAIDSVVYTYLPNSDRGSNYNNDTIDCDFYLDPWVMPGSEKGNRIYNNKGQLVAHHQQELNTDTLWEEKQIDSFVYNNNRLVLHFVFRRQFVSGKMSLVITEKNEYKYNSQSLLTEKVEVLYYVWSGDSLVKHHYITYNGNNLPITDSVRTYEIGLLKWYELYYVSYNANQDTLLWERYSVDNKGNNKALFSKIDYYYNTQGLLMADSLSYGTGNSSAPIKHSYAYDAQNRLIADTIKQYDTPVRTTVIAYSFTPFGYHSRVDVGTVDANSNVSWYSRTAYQYQHYWPVNVKETISNNNTLTLYPNPATDVLHIDSKADFVKGYIYNNMGQLVQTITADAKQVDISTLPVGNYTLQLRTNDKTRIQPFIIVR